MIHKEISAISQRSLLPFKWVSCAITIVGLCAQSYSLTAAQYVSQFNALLGGRQAKIVWCRGGTSGVLSGYNEQYIKAQLQNSEIMCMDTKDGIVRQLTDNSTDNHLDMPSITADGRRVTFFDRATLKVYVKDWDGKNQR